MGSILDQFITNVDELVGRETRPAVISLLVAAQMRQLLEHHSNWLPHKYTVLPPGLQNKDHLIHMSENESWSLEAFVWKMGAITPIHDHGTWGVVGQYTGQELDIRYMMLKGNVQEDRADLAENGRIHMNPGQVVVLVPPDDIHQVRNTFFGQSVSIHVYGGNMKKIDRYEFDLNTGKITIDRRR